MEVLVPVLPYPACVPPTDRMRRETEATLVKVRDAATEVFATGGLESTIADVAERAGVGVATIHRRFASKDELIYEVYRDRLHAAEEVARKASEGADAWDSFAGFFDESIRVLMADRGFWELTTSGFTDSVGWSRETSQSRLPELLAEHRRTVGGYLEKLIRRAHEAGQLRTDFEPMDMMVLSAGVQATITFGDEASRRALGFVLDGLRTSPE